MLMEVWTAWFRWTGSFFTPAARTGQFYLAESSLLSCVLTMDGIEMDV